MMGCCRAGATWAKRPSGKRSGYGTNTSGRRGRGQPGLSGCQGLKLSRVRA